MAFACIFPGQGSQSVGMLADLAGTYPGVTETFEEASDTLGYDLWRLVGEGPETELGRTDRTQPAMLAAGVAVWRLWRGLGGPLPTGLAGHSLGEYTALVGAESLAFADAVGLVAARGALMQEAVPEGEGAMAAVLGLDDEAVVSVCELASDTGIVEAANFNSPGQVVIAGSSAAVARAVDLAKQAGAKRALSLSVSVPSHCSLMKPAAEQLAERLRDVSLKTPVLPVYQNVDAMNHNDPDQIRDCLVRQLYKPVRWVATVRALNTRTLVECGPGKVLSGLNRRIDRDIQALSIMDAASMDQALETIQSNP